MKRIALAVGFILAAVILIGEDNFKQDLDYAQVVYVKAIETGNNSWHFSVSVRHRDEGWDHYSNVWQVVHPETGVVIGERVLAHPHDNEQPFTRSLSGIQIPRRLDEVTVRAGCTIHGFGGREVTLPITADFKTDLYEVEKN
jgi:hypothetical protein